MQSRSILPNAAKKTQQDTWLSLDFQVQHYIPNQNRDSNPTQENP